MKRGLKGIEPGIHTAELVRSRDFPDEEGTERKMESVTRLAGGFVPETSPMKRGLKEKRAEGLHPTNALFQRLPR